MKLKPIKSGLLIGVLLASMWVATPAFAEVLLWDDDKSFIAYICAWTTPTKLTKVITAPQRLEIHAETNASGELSVTGSGGKSIDFFGKSRTSRVQEFWGSINRPYPLKFPVTVTFTFQCKNDDFKMVWGTISLRGYP